MTESKIEQLAHALGIDQIPEFWKTNQQAFEEWKSSGGCGIAPGDIPSNARDVFDLPPGCMPDVESVCAEVRSNPSLAELANLWHFLLFHLPGGRGLPEGTLPAPTGVLGDRAPIFHIAVLVSGTEHALEVYRAMGVSREIALDSLAQCGSQVRDHYAKHGVYGMRYLGWMRNYFQGKMFRLGRLVFNTNEYTWGFRVYRHKTTGDLLTLCPSGARYRTDGLADGCNGISDPDAWVSEVEIGADFARGNPVSPTGEAVREAVRIDMREWAPLITPGDHMIEIHIPGYSSGGKMLWEDCAESYRQALEFFPRYYPQMRFTAFTCWSWLLDPGLAKILPPESNIVRFQSPFHLLPVHGNEHQCYDLAFGDSNVDISTFPPRTSLQRAIVEYVLAGNRMRSTAGVMTMDEIRTLTCRSRASRPA